jgi:hypothetical protein
MAIEQTERLKAWINSLTTEEKNALILDMVEEGIEQEYICFYDENLAPYYSMNGEPLVPGQEIYDEYIF